MTEDSRSPRSAKMGRAADSLVMEDARRVAGIAVPWETLEGKTVFVTGATGLIGSLVIRALLSRNAMFGAGIRVIGLTRDVARAAQRLEDNDALSFVAGDVRSLPEIPDDIDAIIHGASETASREFVARPVETIDTALLGTKNVLELSKEKRVAAMVYLSSMEIYGMCDPAMAGVCESDGGYIDTMSVRSSYSEGKRMGECMCAAYASEYGVPVKVLRLTQTFGAGVRFDDTRVFAQFARAAIEKRDIVLKTMGDTVRNYCYTGDAAAAVLYALTLGTPGMAYNAANRDTAISIRDMAYMVRDLFPEAGINVVFDVAADASKLGFNPTMVIKLDPSRLEGLGWRPATGLPEMFKRMIESMRLSR